MKKRVSRRLHRFFGFFIVAALTGVLMTAAQAAQISPNLQKQLPGLTDASSVGTAIIAFNTSSGLNASHIDLLRGVGVTGDKTFPT